MQTGGSEHDEPCWMLMEGLGHLVPAKISMYCVLPWLLGCKEELEGLLYLSCTPKHEGGTEGCCTGCSGSLSVFKSMFFLLSRPALAHELALLACVFPLTLCKNNYPLSVAWVFLFPLIYGGKELVWEDESGVIELQGGCISWLFLSLFLLCTTPHSYQRSGLPGNMH